MVTATSYDWRGRDVDITSVERHLADLWKQLASEHEYSCPVRTHCYNLVIYASTKAEANKMAEGLGKLLERQPSRAIILVSDRWHGATSIDVEASVECPPGSGDRSPRSFERLTVIAHGRAADHL